MERPIDLSALRSFDAVACHGGLGAASRVTGQPKATLSRHLAELERALGLRLVERGSRRLRLTDEGERFHERVRGPLVELAEAAEAAAGGSVEPRGTLRVSAPIVFAHVALLPLVARFQAACPAVTVEVIAEDRHVDPVEDGYDLVIRIDPAPEERLVGRRIATDRRLVVAAPGLAGPGGDAIGASIPSVGRPTAQPERPWRWRDAAGVARTLVPDPRLRLSSLLMVRDAALAGLGAAQLPELLVAADVAAGRLVCWGVLDAPSVEIWALHASRRLPSARLRAFLRVLVGGFPSA